MSRVEFRNVSKTFDREEVIHDLNLEINSGELMVIVGPSGCGKSTLLRLICGLEHLTRGEVLIDNQSMFGINPARRGVAMVFQSYALYPHMSVADNMGFPLRMSGIAKAERAVRVDEAARVLRLEDFLDRMPRHLSGGQRQRVAIGRAIVRNPKVFLFDEPLSNLDAELRVQMRLEITSLHRQLAATMIYVTHDQVEAMTMADRIVVLREGRIEQVGTPAALYQHPGNLFVAGFIGSPRMNLLRAEVVSTSSSGIDIGLEGLEGRILTVPGFASLPAPGSRLTLGIRPEAFVPAQADTFCIDVDIKFCENLGGVMLLHAPDQPFGSIVIEARRTSSPGLGKATYAVDDSELHLFDENGLTLERC